MKLITKTSSDGVISAKFINGGSDEISGYRICFSLLSKCSVVSGCKILRQFGGYVEMAPDNHGSLKIGEEWNFSFKYDFDRHLPANVSWGPMGSYLKLNDGQTVDVISEPIKFPDSHVTRKIKLSAEEPELRLIPHPLCWRKKSGTCSLTGGINLTGKLSKTEKKVISSFQLLIERMGFSYMLNEHGLEVSFENSEKNFGKEEYEMQINSDQVKISASHYSGYFYSLVSLLQLREVYNDSVPCGKIRDSPRFIWRGQHLDCARHFYQVESILRLLDLMAFLKINRFHWHLIDDESFRLELPSFPELAQRTGLRGDGHLIPGVFGGGRGPEGGTYSAEDVKRINEHAKSLGISVMPEIEIPAHANALVKVLPGLRDQLDESNEESVQGYLENTINPAKEETWEFLEKAIPEIKSMFPFDLIHLGCDEMPDKVWEKSPAINELKKQQGLESTEDVQEWTMNRAAEIVEKAGGRPAAWEVAGEGKNGGIGHDAVIFSWSGKEPGLKALRDGYEVVMCPAQHVYFDMAHTDGHHEKGLNWAANISMMDALCWDPVPEDEPELELKIIGIQGELWSETVMEDKDMEPLLAPRILALSEVAWTDTKRKREFKEFIGAAEYYGKLFKKFNWNSHELV